MKPLLNQNFSLVTCLNTAEFGYKLFETVSFKKVSLDDDYQVLFGPLRFFVPLYESQICLFVGTACNLNFPPDQIVIWDDSRKRKTGIIMLKGTCDDLKVRKELVICSVNFQVLIFDIFTMKLVSVLDNCSDLLPVSISYQGNPIIVAYQCKLNISQVKICKLKTEKIPEVQIENFLKKRNPSSFSINFAPTFQLKSRVQYVISTLFKEIYLIEISIRVSSQLIILDRVIF